MRGVYQHSKGTLYEVVGEARHSETHEALVLYREVGSSEIPWARPKTMWNEPVTWPDGTTGPRFRQVEPE